MKLGRPRNPARIAAELAGAITYCDPSKPCKRGHTERYVTNATCRQCNLRSALQRYYADPYLHRPEPDLRQFAHTPLSEAIRRIAEIRA